MITLVTTIGDLPPNRQGPVLAAMAMNAGHAEVDAICIVTEGSVEWLLSSSEIDTTKFSVVPVPSRPTFADIIAIANDCLNAGAGAVAMLNADISFASGPDIVRAVQVLEDVGAHNGPVVLALARHETEQGDPRLSLYDANGLPNTLSADMWLFSRPLYVNRELFYCLGQMNCDMLFAYDLTTTGHRVYNPCLDVMILHHEPEKDDAFYREQNSKSSAQTLIEKHRILNDIRHWNYHGIPWVKVAWMNKGYLPKHNSTNGARIIVAIERVDEFRYREIFKSLSDILSRRDIEIQVLCEGDLDKIAFDNLSILAAHPNIWLAKPCQNISATRRALLRGDQYSFNRLAFVDDLSRIDDAVLAAADGVFVTVRQNPVVPPDAEFGCTLVTSVFRSDPFLRGFLNNCKALLGYGQQIEQVFLVSAMSEMEVDTFNALLASQTNALVLWHRHDPGLYECWNIGVRLARTDYVSNANVDDLRDPRHVLTLVQELICHPEAVVVATALVPFYEYPVDGTLPAREEIWYAEQAGSFGFRDIAHVPDFNAPRLDPHNMPHCMPVWRRSLHTRHGWFDEGRFGTFADWAFWLKALEDGSRGRLHPDPLGFYFVNPTSHNRRGSDLEVRHRAVEDEFLASFLARTQGQRTPLRVLPAEIPRKFHLYGRELFFGQHRNARQSNSRARASGPGAGRRQVCALLRAPVRLGRRAVRR